MKYLIKILLLISCLLLFSCAKDKVEVEKLKETDQQMEMITAYKDGMKNLDKGDYFYASKKFLEAELLFPQSKCCLLYTSPSPRD